MVRRWNHLLACATVAVVTATAAANAAASDHWWDEKVQTSLAATGTNQAAWVAALSSVPEKHREAVSFLLANMPRRDLRRLSPAFILGDVELAYQAWEGAPWHAQVSKELFMEDILPYANTTEPREAWRKELRELSLPLVAECRSPGEAARRINEKLFGIVKVKYSTKRKRADQSPSESMQTGLASCTGLSILLADACRSVGVPARLAGVPNWIDDRGNHTWVEVWDERWHFVGAAEPDPNGLDHAWFQHDASLAVKDSREHAVYAVSYAKTGIPFPSVWDRDQDFVNAINVTDHYAVPTAAKKSGQTRLMVKVMDQVGGKCLTAKVRVLPELAAKAATPLGEGSSRDERFDTNDLLSFDLASDHKYVVEVAFEGSQIRREITLGSSAQEMATVYVRQPESSVLPGCVNPAVLPAAFAAPAKR